MQHIWVRRIPQQGRKFLRHKSSTGHVGCKCGLELFFQCRGFGINPCIIDEDIKTVVIGFYALGSGLYGRRVVDVEFNGRDGACADSVFSIAT